MLREYVQQVHLVTEVLPFVAVEDCFAIKGGTAINLFELNLPRLSVDIDLTYVKMTGRDEAIGEINLALERIVKELKKAGIDARLSGADNARKMYCSRDKIIIKVEPNFILRGTAYPVRPLKVCNRIVELTRNETVMQVLSFKELYGGKVCAALDRQHPRDLFDMAQFYKSHSLDEIKEGFLVLALGHNRPLHELLAPVIQEQSEIFDQQFAGMSDEPFSYDEHLATLERLTADVKDLFDDGDKQRLLDFVSLSGEENAWGIPHFDELPAIRWKRHNLESLRKSNPRKFTAQRESLERLFEEETLP